MRNSQFFIDAITGTQDYIYSLKKEDSFSFYPSNNGLTKYGKKLELGFSNYALKLYFMLGIWKQLENSEKENWKNYINSFQSDIANFPKNSFIDKVILESYNEFNFLNFSKEITRKILNTTGKFNFEIKNTRLKKAINAETKQSISTLWEVGSSNNLMLENLYTSNNELFQYLDSLNWQTPWTSGAQFSSLCVYSTTQKFNYEEDLMNFITKKANYETGAYFSKMPNSSREVINGAMKVISGLDWLEREIHYPEKLIDFCLANEPIHEGCDVVDFIYVLYKCSKQTKYRKDEVNKLLYDQAKVLRELFRPNEGGFSYFRNKSQTHYYGVEITTGENSADIHGTLLCIWAIMMILDSNELLDTNYNIIKP